MEVLRKTKIICTLGPNAENYETLKKMGEYMDVGRFNFSHGSYDEHKKKLELLKKVRVDLDRPIAALLDTKGPEIRTGLNENGEKISFEIGDKVDITVEDVLCNHNIISVSYKGFVEDVKVGDSILIDDGLMEFKVINKNAKVVTCEVISGGALGEHKGINLPGVKIELPDLTDKDVEDIKFGIEEGFDIIAASFVRSAKCIYQIRDILNRNNSNMLIIAKIENQEGIHNIDEIIEAADGIMVARGDLGVEVKPAEVPYLQKMMIKKCNEKGKLVITATQMLDSMIKNPRPTRAEVADVANAIYDGTDCIMLSGETANGKYPVESVSMMNDIAVETETHIDNMGRIEKYYMKGVDVTITNTICKSAAVAADELMAKAIVVPTLSGHTAKILSKFKPNMPIYALSEDEMVVRQLMLYYGVISYKSTRPKDSDTIIGNSINQLKEMKKLDVGDLVVIAFGRTTEGAYADRTKVKPHTDTMRIEQVS